VTLSTEERDHRPTQRHNRHTKKEVKRKEETGGGNYKVPKVSK